MLGNLENKSSDTPMTDVTVKQVNYLILKKRL